MEQDIQVRQYSGQSLIPEFLKTQFGNLTALSMLSMTLLLKIPLTRKIKQLSPEPQDDFFFFSVISFCLLHAKSRLVIVTYHNDHSSTLTCHFYET